MLLYTQQNGRKYLQKIVSSLSFMVLLWDIFAVKSKKLIFQQPFVQDNWMVECG